MSDPRARWGLWLALVGGLVCLLAGVGIAVATIWYGIAHEEEFRRFDTTGIPTGPMTAAFCCGWPLLASGFLCTVGTVLCAVGIIFGQQARKQK